MSWTVVKAVLDGFSGSCSEKLCLVVLAEWSDDNGLSWPSVDSIARRMCVSRSQAQRTLKSVIDRKAVAVIGNLHGGSPGSTRRYRINLDAMTGRTDATPTGSTHATGSVNATGRIDAQDGPHGCADTGRMDATQTTIEPPMNQGEADKPPTPSKSVTFSTWMKNIKAVGERAITDHQAIWDYAQRIGLPAEFVDLAWLQFKRRYLKDQKYQSKCQKDWRQVFRNAIEGNWFKLWYATADGYALTTQGIQAQRELDAMEVTA